MHQKIAFPVWAFLRPLSLRSENFKNIAQAMSSTYPTFKSKFPFYLGLGAWLGATAGIFALTLLLFLTAYFFFLRAYG